MAKLLERREPQELSSQIRDAFGRKAREWNAAMTELLAFSLLEELRRLHEIGYPKGPNIKSEFEGTLLDLAGTNRNAIPFDVKAAFNYGLDLLERRFCSVVDQWSDSNKLPKAEMELKTSGPATVETVGDSLPNLVQDLRTQLGMTRTFPTAPIVLKVSRDVDPQTALEPGPKISVSVEIRPSTGLGVNHFGVVKVADKAESIAEVVKGHVEAKANQASKLGCVFAIIYVRPPQSGMADVESRGLQMALGRLHSDAALLKNPNIERWLGTIMFDWTPTGTPFRYGSLRASSRWPMGSTPETLSASLQLTAWS
ncbi:MAG: hypothetical protein WAL95_19260 [Candidatus Acidiferrales bacterium]